MKDTSKPAFPVPDDAVDMPGMTLRDYFAAKAMQAVLMTDLYSENPRPQNLEFYRAKDAYRLADAMLKARAEK